MADWRAVARQAAQRNGLDAGVFIRQIQQESGGRDVTSPAGAQGPAQFEPGTAASVGLNSRTVHQLGPSLDAAAKLMAGYVRKYGSVRNALIAYNAGPGVVGSRSLPKETQDYLRIILGNGNGSNGSGDGGRTTGATAASPSIAGQTVTTTTPGVDNSALRRQIVGQFLGQGGVRNSNALMQFASAYKGAGDVTGSTETVNIPGSGGSGGPSASTSASGSVTAGKGAADFEGRRVAAWIAPALTYARSRGWKGTVTSGYRSYAQQKAIYDSGVRPAAKPGTSNHEVTVFPGGAVDVTDAARLAEILKASPYAGKLVWAGAKDPVHFSHPHNGSY